MHVRQTRARQSGLEVGEAPQRNVEGVHASLRAHQRAQEQRLSARAGAEVDHHVAASRGDEIAQELAALVLDFDCAAREERVMLQRRLARHAQPQRRIRRRRAGDTVGGKLRLRCFARRLERIDTQIERCGGQP